MWHGCTTGYTSQDWPEYCCHHNPRKRRAWRKGPHALSAALHFAENVGRCCATVFGLLFLARRPFTRLFLFRRPRLTAFQELPNTAAFFGGRFLGFCTICQLANVFD